MNSEKGFIKIKDVLQWLFNHENRGIPFSITILSFDEKRKTGGEWMEFKTAVIPTKEIVHKIHGERNTSGKSIDQNKVENATFLIFVPETNRFITAHNDLIFQFQNKRVIF